VGLRSGLVDPALRTFGGLARRFLCRGNRTGNLGLRTLGGLRDGLLQKLARLVEKLITFTRKVGELETKLNALGAPEPNADVRENAAISS